MRRFVSVAVAAIAGTMALGGDAAVAARAEQQLYGPGVVYEPCFQALDAGLGRGCFDVALGESAIAVTVDDDVSEAVNASVTFYRLSDHPLTNTYEKISTAAFCTSSGTLAIPAGTVSVDVQVVGAEGEVLAAGGGAITEAIGGTVDDSPCGFVTGATTGTITALFE